MPMATAAVSPPTRASRAAMSASVTSARLREVRRTSRSDGVTAAGGALGARLKRIAHSAHSAQRLGLAERSQLAPQVVDVQVDHVRIDVRLGAPDRIEDLLPRHHLAGI